ncbi:MAG: aminopeptidase P family protein [Salinibacter sp.]
MFDASTYHSRRRTLIDAERPESGLVLLLGNRPSPQNYAANTHPFRQDSTFLYYFGLDRPNLSGLIDLDEGTATLYGDDGSLEDVIWSGGAPSLRERASDAGVDRVAPLSALTDTLRTAREQNRPVHFLPPYRADHRLRYHSLLGLPSDQLDEHVSEPLIQAVIRQRAPKSEVEVAEIEEALARTARLHEYAQRHAAPGTTEQDLIGDLTGLVTRMGSAFAFTPTCSIHGEFLHNHSYPNTLADGDLLLVDAGACSPRHYAGDITRTTPVSGTFTPRQRRIYEAVLAAQESALDVLEPGVPFVDVHRRAARTLTEHLIQIGLMQGDPEMAVAEGAHALFFPHGLGHLIGLDVHDMESLGEDRVGYAEDQTRSDQFGLHTLRLARPLRPGFVVSVEPGCYFIPPLVEHWRSENHHEAFIDYDCVEDFLGFGGVRIEDNVLVTEDSARMLGPGIPKRIDEVETQAAAAPRP